MEEEFIQCQGPGCSRTIRQVTTGRGHRIRLYCSKNCRMAACRARQRAAEEEDGRQRLLALERAEKGELQNRFPLLSAESIELLYQLKKQYGPDMVTVIGTALLREREQAAPVPQQKDLLQANHLEQSASKVSA
jgi:hypothetical protein